MIPDCLNYVHPAFTEFDREDINWVVDRVMGHMSDLEKGRLHMYPWLLPPGATH